MCCGLLPDRSKISGTSYGNTVRKLTQLHGGKLNSNNELGPTDSMNEVKSEGCSK